MNGPRMAFWPPISVGQRAEQAVTAEAILEGDVHQIRFHDRAGKQLTVRLSGTAFHNLAETAAVLLGLEPRPIKYNPGKGKPERSR